MLQKLCFTLVLALLLPLAASAQRMPEERGYDHRHGDYDDFRADDVAECRRACERARRCRAYTFNLRTEMCYLKDRVNPIERNIDMVTGSKERWEEPDEDFSEEEGYDYRGGDYHSFRSSGVRECRRECADDRRCVAYTYNLRSEVCYLKDRIGSHQRNEDTVTGLREGNGGGLGGSWPGRVELTEERGYDYRGGDYRSFRTSGVSRCKDECREDSRCQGYSFNLETDTCYLKDRIGNYQRNQDTVTGIKSETGGSRPWSGDELTEEDGYDYRGGDYDSFEASGVSACKSACRRDDRCVAYTYNRRSDTCYLKDRVGEYQRNSDTVTGVKE